MHVEKPQSVWRCHLLTSQLSLPQQGWFCSIFSQQPPVLEADVSQGISPRPQTSFGLGVLLSNLDLIAVTSTCSLWLTLICCELWVSAGTSGVCVPMSGDALINSAGWFSLYKVVWLLKTLPNLFRLKLFHARHFPRAVFHPLLSLPFCFKMQPKISAVSEHEVREHCCCVMAEQGNLSAGAIFRRLQRWGREKWAVGAGCGSGISPMVPALRWQLPLWTRVGDYQSDTEVFPMGGSRNHSLCPERPFCAKSLTLLWLGLMLASEQSKVWEITMSACFFSPLSIHLHHKLLNLQVKLQQNWGWEGRRVLEKFLWKV